VKTFVVVGAGGLGCPALLGLLAGGAESIWIVDHDRVDASNLHRQVLFTLADVGSGKAEAAAFALRQRRRNLDVRAISRRVHEVDDFLDTLPRDAIVLECTDQPAIKFAFNDACLRRGVPLVIGAALGLHGQVMCVAAGHACYRCIYESPPADLPSCDAAGVLGPAVGAAGFVMASAALRLAAGAVETSGRLLAIDCATGRVQTLAPRPRSSCDACQMAAS
jgi:molybdopterin/thiamine biosynthesis adenylyltransferase